LGLAIGTVTTSVSTFSMRKILTALQKICRKPKKLPKLDDAVLPS